MARSAARVLLPWHHKTALRLCCAPHGMPGCMRSVLGAGQLQVDAALLTAACVTRHACSMQLPQVPQLASAPAALPASTLFDGLVHVRFTFDRGATRRMQKAIAAVGRQQLQDAACWVTPDVAPAAGGPGSSSAAGSGSGSESSSSSSSSFSAAAVQRLLKLQPGADAVAAAAAAMQERGRQRLNAEQRSAVAAVVCGAGRAFPYALFGPPGALVHALAPRLSRSASIA